MRNSQGSEGSWWEGRPVRIYHPNPGEAELRDFDTTRFLTDCAASHAEAIVVSAAGIYAFYPSRVPYHYVSPVIGDRDLMQEIGEAGRALGLRIIARVDFSKAREDVFEAHPEWFARQASGDVMRSGAYYLTCPSGGYQNEAFAHLVLQELLDRYDVDGFHVNAGGFPGICACDACTTAFGEPVPREGAALTLWERYLRWRHHAIAEEFSGCYQVVQATKPDAFFMSELAGQEYPGWARSKGFHLPELADAFSQLLVSSGGVAHARSSRWWVGMSSDRARAASPGQKTAPIINIKVHMRDLNINQTMMPPAEFSFLACQAMAHGAGLKIPTFGIPATLRDPRAMPAIAAALGMMERQQSVFDTMVPVSQVGLVWPSLALFRAPVPGVVDAEGLEKEFAGLYTALVAAHLQFRVVYDQHLRGEILKDLDVLIVPTTVGLTDDHIQALLDMADRGGRVVVLDSPAAGMGGFQPVPPALAAVIGIEFGWGLEKAAYALPDAKAPEMLRENGPLPLLYPYRRFVAAIGVEVWLWAAASEEMHVPEDADPLRLSKNPVLVRALIGEGDLLYLATGGGEAVMDLGHADHLAIVAALVKTQSGFVPLVETDAPACVNIVLARWATGWVVHVVNAAGSAPLVDEVPVGPITIALTGIEASRVTWVVPGDPDQPLSFEQAGDRLQIVVPPVKVYGQVVIV